MFVHWRKIADFNLELFELAQIPADQLGNLTATRCEPGEPKLPAGIAQCFYQCHVVAALGGNSRGFHAGRARAHNENLFRCIGFHKPISAPFKFAPGGRIDQA